jgi:MoxR-like ATPase
VEQQAQFVNRLRHQVAQVIVGQQYLLDRLLVGLLANGHVLIEGVPGLAKTTAVNTMARAMDCQFKRIQFTPDLLPADLIGTLVYNPKSGEFTTKKGPIFGNIILADEINRAPAKTQSALLQAMQERRVTIDRDTHILSPNFTVFATQNPIEYEGTYPLPEAQKDRFLFKITMGYPDRAEEVELARRMLEDDAPEKTLDQNNLQPILTADELSRMRAVLNLVTVRQELREYMVDLVRQTRQEDSILVGAGPRATQAILLSSRAHAAISGRDFVTPDDVKAVALPVLEHRLLLRPESEIEGVTVAEVIERVLQRVAVPR